MLNQLKSQHSMALFAGFVAIVLLAAILSVQAPVAWATAPQDRTHQTAPTAVPTPVVNPVNCEIPQPGITCQNTDSAGLVISVTVPANSPDVGGTLVIQMATADQTQTAPAGSVLIGQQWIVQIKDAQGNVVTGQTFNPPLTICREYSADMATQAGGAANLKISFYNTTTGQWESLPTTQSTSSAGKTQVCAQVTHLTLFGLLAKTPSTLPVTGAALDNTSTLALLVVLIVAAMSAGFVLKSRVRA